MQVISVMQVTPFIICNIQFLYETKMNIYVVDKSITLHAYEPKWFYSLITAN